MTAIKQATLHRYGIVVEASKERGCFGNARETIPYNLVITAKDIERNGQLTRITYLTKGGATHEIRTIDLNITNRDDCSDGGIESSLGTAEKINELAYPGPKRHRQLILINPFGGTGDAERRFNKYARPVLVEAGVSMDIRKTTHSGHARELAMTIDLREYDAIICVSGDGLPHEVLNGLAERPDAETAIKTPLCQLPGGSGNAMCHSLNQHGGDWLVASLAAVKGSALEVDLMRISQGDKVFYSFLSQSFGIVADSDLGTESWRWMGGFRFTLGVIVRCLQSRSYPARLSYKLLDAEETDQFSAQPLFKPKYGSVKDPIPSDWVQSELLNLTSLYVGKMPYMSSDAIVFPHAAPNDGAMDMLTFDSSIGSIRTLMLFDKMSHGGHAKEADAKYQKVVAYRLEPLKKNFVSVDGEQFPCEPFQVEIVPRAAVMLSLDGDFRGRA